MSMARRERRALVDTMDAVGPDAPTLSGEWTVRDLAAHLIVRERRMDAAPGILLRPFASHLKRVQDKVARRPFPVLLDQVRSGPPWWSPLRPVDALVNLSEMFVHHEDVRRAAPDWAPRDLSPADQRHLWAVLKKMGPMTYRASPVPIELVDTEGERIRVGARDGDIVTLTGPAAELLLHAFGRDQVRIETAGEPEAVQAVLALDRSV
ncbi:TIGR03085 family metal-binding protein [Nocardia donostiensis]|uniref:TIGR03085 family protein n=1 Tax=Nocardia donostiensis TaxID=1538463 RepID=A0A1W0BJN8_9NOCA|nr:TIGR03085 family metal-binding protein [Nocardia donostiensis]ONM47794.1 TIGR03085 family protein [Nocardia donostiensis]OQS13725.1 TIGR03085 family protein [Nocardia donostiensis]OQS22546.1 TIGR03085 family protein [Nocardia donostiensis]